MHVRPLPQHWGRAAQARGRNAAGRPQLQGAHSASQGHTKRERKKERGKGERRKRRRNGHVEALVPRPFHCSIAACPPPLAGRAPRRAVHAAPPGRAAGRAPGSGRASRFRRRFAFSSSPRSLHPEIRPSVSCPSFSPAAFPLCGFSLSLPRSRSRSLWPVRSLLYVLRRGAAACGRTARAAAARNIARETKKKGVSPGKLPNSHTPLRPHTCARCGDTQRHGEVVCVRLCVEGRGEGRREGGRGAKAKRPLRPPIPALVVPRPMRRRCAGALKAFKERRRPT